MANIATSIRGSVSPELSGEELFLKEITNTDPGVEQTLISYVVPSGQTINLLQIIITCAFEGEFQAFIDSDQIGSGRTGAANKNVSFNWLPCKKILSGETFVIKFTQGSYRPATSIEAYVQARII